MKRFYLIFILLLTLLAGTRPGFAQATPADLLQTPHLLSIFEKQAFDYFLHTCSTNGLMPGRIGVPEQISSAGSGYMLTALCIGTERGWISRPEAMELLNRILQQLESLPRFHGFWAEYYQLPARTPLAISHPENNGGDTMATAILAAGLYTAATFFELPPEAIEPETIPPSARIQALLDGINWPWMLRGLPPGAPDRFSLALFCSASPAQEFPVRQRLTSSYNMAGSLAYILGAASRTHPLPPEAWNLGWAGSFERLKETDDQLIICPPLVSHQLAHIWLNLENLPDRHADYFRNSIYATRANRAFCMSELSGGQELWGLSDTMGPTGYSRYGYPPLLGTVQKDAVLTSCTAFGSLLFTPSRARACIENMARYNEGTLLGEYGVFESFSVKEDWFFKGYSTAGQALVLSMLANARDHLPQRCFMANPDIKRALDALGFRGVVADFEPTPDTVAPYTTLIPSRSYDGRLETGDVPDGDYALHIRFDKEKRTTSSLAIQPNRADFSYFLYLSCWVNSEALPSLALVDQNGTRQMLRSPVRCTPDDAGWQRLFFALPRSGELDLTAIRRLEICAAPGQLQQQGDLWVDGVYLLNSLDTSIPAAPQQITIRPSRMPGEAVISWPKTKEAFRYTLKWARSAISTRKAFNQAATLTSCMPGAQTGSREVFYAGNLPTGVTLHMALEVETLSGNRSPQSASVSITLPEQRAPNEFALEAFDEISPFMPWQPSQAIQAKRVTDVSLEGAGCLEITYRKIGRANLWAALPFFPDVRNFSDYRYLTMWVAGQADLVLRLYDASGAYADTTRQVADNINSWSPVSFDLTALSPINLAAVEKIELFIEPNKTNIEGTLFVDSITLTKTRN